MSIDTAAALRNVRTGVHRALMIICYVFLLFSVWFTLRAAVCSFLEEQVIFMVHEENGEIVAVPTIQCSDRLHQIFTSVSMFVPLKELSGFANVLVTIVLMYWVGFWVVESCMLDLPDTATKKEKAVLFFQALVDSSSNQVSDFVNYWAVVFVSATIFAVTISPLCLDASFRTCHGPPTAAMVLGETWRLFMMHLVSSSMVAHAMYVSGPLLGWYPEERGPVWFVGLSVMLSTAMHVWEILFEATLFG